MEQSFLAYLRGRTRLLPQVAVGIGDDAAVLDFPGPSGPAESSGPNERSGVRQLACTDQIIDGVDFVWGTHSGRDVGYKSVAINLSDIAAMGGVPTAALVTLTLPAENATEIAGDVYEGILEACQEYGVAIAGGDLSTYDGPLAISVTLLGTCSSPWLRSGGEVGDAVLVSGQIGGSLLGRHLRPTPRIELAREIRQHATVHAAIDISDGFSLDLDRLCAASRLGVELDFDALPISDAAHTMAQTSGRTPHEHAWSDGEDFELILTMPPDDADRLLMRDLSAPLTRVGTLVSRTGLWKRTEGSKFQRVFPQGFLHAESQ